MTPIDFERAQSAHAQFLRTVPITDAIKGIGIGLTKSRDAYALEILVDAEDPDLGLPKSINGVPIVYRVIGKIVAQ